MRSFSLSASWRFSSVIGSTSPPGIQYEPPRAISTSGAPLTKQRTTGLPLRVLHIVEGGHELVIRVEGHFGHAGIRLAGAFHADAALLGQDDQRAFGRVADQGLAIQAGIGAQRHGQHHFVEIDLGAACAQHLPSCCRRGTFLPGLPAGCPGELSSLACRSLRRSPGSGSDPGW